MVAKYYVWGEGVWRELDVAAGRVAGWRRRARFVFVRRGRLLVARRRTVLRALAALAAGQPSAAADGARLEYLRKSVASHKRPKHPAAAPAAPPTPVCEHHHCCAHFNGYKDRVVVAPPAPPTPRREASTQCGQRDAGTSTERPLTISVAPAPPAPAAASDSSADEFVSRHVRREAASDVSALLGATSSTPAPASNKRALKDARAGDSGDGAPRRKKKRARAADNTDTSPESRGAGGAGRRAVCKELIISEAHVAALRGFVARTRPSALARFDADEAYKRALFYAINPLVELQPCARLERLLRERHAAALPHFAARLGLTPTHSPPAPRPAPERSPPVSRPAPAPSSPAASPVVRLARHPPSPRKRLSAEADTDKENKDKHSSPNRVRSDATAALKTADTAGERGNKQKDKAETTAAQTNGDTGEALRARRRAARVAGGGGTHVISKRAMGHKEYSNLEDHAIVAWVSVGARASLVKGNQLWRELQEQFPRLAGGERSWHSLRNRYLRYILPALGALRLPPDTEARLRAAAAAGAIKTKARAAAGLGALPRRNSLFAEAPRGAASRRVRAASSTGGSSGDDALARQAVRESPPAKPGGSRQGRSPRYSEVTRRFAARRAVVSSSSASPPPRAARSPSPATVSTRSRKLFNPNTNV